MKRRWLHQRRPHRGSTRLAWHTTSYADARRYVPLHRSPAAHWKAARQRLDAQHNGLAREAGRAGHLNINVGACPGQHGGVGGDQFFWYLFWDRQGKRT
jgi:hypothetical protein